MKKHGRLRIGLSLMLALQLVLAPAVFAKDLVIPGLYKNTVPSLPTVSAIQTPVTLDGGTLYGASVNDAVNGKMVINQTESKAILDWATFNIGKKAWVQFDQQGNTDWAALNRIYDANPSQIYGRLTADGEVFLINQNGILFGPGSQIDVHSLTASSLDIAQEDFLANTLSFTGDASRGAVSNHGEIQAGTAGSVFLIGPEVENYGTIDAPGGQVGLAAGTDVDIQYLEAGTERIYPYVHVASGGGGTVTNASGGSITADTGIAGLYGADVNQEGYIRSITAVTSNGRIELHAENKVTLGADSVTETPISNEEEEVHSSFSLSGGEISIAGLDRINPNLDELTNEVKKTVEIEHHGTVSAPSGSIEMAAEEQIYLAPGSTLDAGGEWVVTDAASTVTATLNSVELKTNYVLKDGVLQGQEIEVVAQEGSTIGDLSAYLSSEYLTAEEMATAGGEIDLSSEGEIIVREGAVIDISGGGLIVGDGYNNVTRLLSGNIIYNISSAPSMLQYDSVATYQEKIYERYGISESYEGFYLGGANPLLEYTAGYLQGDDAGRLIVNAPDIVFNGTLNAWATAGYYQTETMVPEIYYGNFAVQTASGVRMPRGGELVIGDESPTEFDGDLDYVLDEVVIASGSTDLPENFGPGDSLPEAGETGYTTILSAEIINRSGLSDLSVYANSKITVDKDVELTLKPGGLRVDDSVDYVDNQALEYLDEAPASLDFRAGGIDFGGSVKIPSGDIALSIHDTVGDESDFEERVLLSGGSRIDVSGETIDNSLADRVNIVEQIFLDGGSISVTDSTRTGGEVIVAPGAELDVSGGYVIGTSGSLDAGSAGTIMLGGAALVVQGELLGHALVDAPGGTINLQTAGGILVQSDAGPILDAGFGFDDPLSGVLADTFFFEDDQLDDSGFAHISLTALEDVTIADGASLQPSKVKLAFPTVSGGILDDGRSDYATMPLDTLGSTSISITAGAAFGTASPGEESLFAVNLASSAVIEVAPGGTISLLGLNADIYGNLFAPAGTVSISATGEGTSNGQLTLYDGSRVDASGTNRLIEGSTVAGIGSVYEIMDGGTVTLSAEAGSVTTQAGSVVDISGSKPVESLFYSDDGVTVTTTTRTMASNAGSLVLEYEDGITLDGGIDGQASIDSAYGASLYMVSNSLTNPVVIEQAAVNGYQQDGFDALAFSSLDELVLAGDIRIDLGLSLTLDAPLIIGSGEPDQQVELSAASISLTNTQAKYVSDAELSHDALIDDEEIGGLVAADGDSILTLDAEFIDVTGDVAIAGFATTRLDAAEDIQLTDEIYYGKDSEGNDAEAWSGRLWTPDDLVLKAARIYPTTNSSFTLSSEKGRITTLPSGRETDSPIVSAGGRLTVTADEIDHQGYLTAPMGSIDFKGSEQDGNSTIFLADGSVTSVAGSGAVVYGTLDDIYWTLDGKPTELTDSTTIQSELVSTVPDKGVTIIGDTVVMQEGALIDVSGGGSIFAYEFLPGADGLVNPFLEDGTYVIVPGVDYAGSAVQLSGGGGVPAGTYSLLPVSYAYLDGAHVIQYLGSANTVDGVPAATAEGYSVVTGFKTVAGTGYTASEAGLYSIRTAAEVFAEGDFSMASFTAGSGGSVTVQGTTTVLDGVFNSAALPGCSGGAFAVSGAQSAVVRASSALGSNYLFNDIQKRIEAFGYQDSAQILDKTLSASGAEQLSIGSLAVTDLVTIEADADLTAPIITLTARNEIRLQTGSRINTDQATFTTPDGRLNVDADALVAASERVDIEAHDMRIDGQLTSEGGTLGVISGTIVVADDAYAGDSDTALYLSESLQGFSGFDNLEMAAGQVHLMGDVVIGLAGTLSMDASALTGDTRATLQASQIRLLNTSLDAYTGSQADLAELILTADDEIIIGHGHVVLDGFDTVTLAAGSDLIFSGDGSLVSSGDLTFSADHLTTSYYQDDQADFESADFSVLAANRAIIIQSGDGLSAGTTDTAGGVLEILGDSITMNDGVIEMTGGWVDLAAQSGDINLNGTSRIDVAGNDYGDYVIDGGRVTLTADNGSINLGAGSIADVSAAGDGDGGSLTLSAINEEVILGDANTILGNADGGKGGSFNLDAGTIADIDALLTALDAGGFDEAVDLRTRTGNIIFTTDDTLTAHAVNLTADNGLAVIAGSIDASGSQGGEVAINADRIFLIGTIDASATSDNQDGGSVALNAVGEDAGALTLAGALIDVSGGSEGTGGSVHFRALQSEDQTDVNMSLDGTIVGAASVTAEGVQRYDEPDGIINATDIDTYHADADAFLANVDAAVLAANLTLTDSAALEIVPGIEATSEGDLTLAAEWDLTNRNKSSQAGVISLRAGGDLNLEGSLVDHPTAMSLLNDSSESSASWGYNLVAGADLSSADTLSTMSLSETVVAGDPAGTGNLNIGDGQMAYTESGTIRFASARDTVLLGGRDFWDLTHIYMVNWGMKYNLATFSGDIQGDVGKDLIIMDSATIQTATGDIDINVGRDLHFELTQSSGSAIRTTGTAPGNVNGLEWLYNETHDGGNIALSVGGSLRMGAVNLDQIRNGVAQHNQIVFYDNGSTGHLLYWDNVHANDVDGILGNISYDWSADYGISFNPTNDEPTSIAGVATMGGGSVSVVAGNDVYGQIGTFKEGDLSVTVQGDISGYFQAAGSRGTITAIGSIVSPDTEAGDQYAYATSIGMFDGQVDVIAQGNLDFGTVLNPTFLQAYGEYFSGSSQLPQRYLDYGETAGVSLTAVNGDLSLAGGFSTRSGSRKSPNTFYERAERVLPSTVNLAAGGDILLGSQEGGDFVLAPSASGNLSVTAGGDIVGLYTGYSNNLVRASLRMSDLDPDAVYRLIDPEDDPVDHLFVDESTSAAHQSGQVLHGDDETGPIVISAGRDIEELKLITAKQTIVSAGDTITGLYFFGQNVDSSDTSIIQAGGNIDLNSITDPALRATGLINGGPGMFVVQAGGDIDLGATQGIQSVGNLYYDELSEEDTALLVSAGLYKQEALTTQQLNVFFDAIRLYGTQYSELLANGDTEGAAAIVAQAQEELLDPLRTDSVTGSGNIEMTSASIQTSAEDGDIFILANGAVDVGKTDIVDPEDASEGVEEIETGIFTNKGGAINLYAMGDVNVNEARVMTFRGGDITVWSESGDINAGRGSTTAINVGSPQRVPDETDEIYNAETGAYETVVLSYKIEWEPPSVGSGIRTLTYDPDGSLGPLGPPEAGSVYLFAPAGVIDAGEAGIAGSNVILGATEVLNAQNIDVSGTSVGVPQTNTGPSVGTLVGAGTISETNKIVEESAAMQSAEKRFSERVAELSDQLVPKWIAVEVVGFEEDDDEK